MAGETRGTLGARNVLQSVRGLHPVRPGGVVGDGGGSAAVGEGAPAAVGALSGFLHYRQCPRGRSGHPLHGVADVRRQGRRVGVAGPGTAADRPRGLDATDRAVPRGRGGAPAQAGGAGGRRRGAHDRGLRLTLPGAGRPRRDVAGPVPATVQILHSGRAGDVDEAWDDEGEAGREAGLGRGPGQRVDPRRCAPVVAGSAGGRAGVVVPAGLRPAAGDHELSRRGGTG